MYDLTNRGKKSKYEYLYQCLKEDILSGKLAEGEKMPSKRRLSEANGISIRTVMNAYEQLLMEGIWNPESGVAIMWYLILIHH